MSTSLFDRLTERGFLRAHVLPVFFILLVPLFSVWFFRYAEKKFDREILAEIEANIQKSNRSHEDKTEAIEYYRYRPLSKMMADHQPAAIEFCQDFKEMQLPYAIFRWGKRLGWACLTLIMMTALFATLSVLLSLRSQQAQYQSLRWGVPLLRGSALLQVLGQGALMIALSYWVTAVLFERYSVKLVIFAAVAVLVVIYQLIRAIFRQVDRHFPLEGRLITEAEAPALWKKIHDVATQLQTAPPNQLIVGIDANFFVTEHPVTHEGTERHGRTLYLSLPLLKVLSAKEAEGVLGHELAHFSGEDTFWGQRISPLLQKFSHYLDALYDSISRPVFHFMLFFFKLYQLSIKRLSRQREFRADRLGAEVSSPEAIKSSLIKINAYCDYRDETELAVFTEKQVQKDLALAQKIETGFPAFLQKFSENKDSVLSHTQHPFDSHPSLQNRLEALGLDPIQALRDPALLTPPTDSWYHAINDAETYEKSLWNTHEANVNAAHEAMLAWKLTPQTPEEIALVQKAFPDRTFTDKKGQSTTLRYDRITDSSCPEPIFYEKIKSCEYIDQLGTACLKIVYHDQGGKKQTLKIPHKKRTHTDGPLDAFFQDYYGRHLNAQSFITDSTKTSETSTDASSPKN